MLQNFRVEVKVLTDCARCKKSIPRMSIESTAVIMLKIQSYLSPTFTKYGVGNCLCYNCYNELFEEGKKERKHSEIECSDCEKKFILVAKKPKKNGRITFSLESY